MRVVLERFARSWWAGELGALGAGLDALTAPIGWGWSTASRARSRRLAGRGAVVEGLTVVSVGNLAVGGTGKTPVAAWVARRLRGRGLPTSVLVGEHGRDEALLHERWNPSAPVLTDRDRLAAARRAHASGARAIVLDDGFQHLRLARDLDVVLLSADDPFPGRVLPRGPYREPEGALARADVVLVTRRAASEEAAVDVARRASAVAPRAVTAGLSLEPDSLASLDSWLGCNSARDTRYGETLSVSSGGGSVLAVCGVGRPEAFRSSTVALVGGEVELMAFPDHHPFGPADVERIRRRAGGRPVVLTEKDAVKLGRHASEIRPALVLLEQPRWSWGEAELDAVLGSLVEEHVGP